MSGILDNKTRIMDTIVTLEGRRQMADGKLKIEYVSFTDNAVTYDPDAVSGSADITNRLYFEQCHLPQDQITFESDDSGRLKPFKGQQAQIINGKIFSGSNENLTFLQGDQFASTADSLIASSINNFNNLQIIGTKDFLFENEGFELSPSNVVFDIHYSIDSEGERNLVSSFGPGFSEIIRLESFPSLFNSKWLENVNNFKYLPPINKVEDKSINKSEFSFLETNKIGNYQKLNNSHDPYNHVKIESDLLKLENSGFKKTITFDPTSLKNNLVSQFFEISDSEVQKLDVIDYGIYTNNGTIKHMFFVGKIRIDEDGSQCFINIFTLVFE